MIYTHASFKSYVFLAFGFSKESTATGRHPFDGGKHSELGSLRVHLTLLGNPTMGPWGWLT